MRGVTIGSLELSRCTETGTVGMLSSGEGDVEWSCPINGRPYPFPKGLQLRSLTSQEEAERRIGSLRE